MIVVVTEEGTYTCVRHNHDHKDVDGKKVPCLACKAEDGLI